jgi:hypothetical protein
MTLRHETEKPFWATPSRYMNKRMLKAFVEELGHDHENLLIGASCDTSGDPNLLLNVATSQVTAVRKDKGEDEDENEDILY